MKLSSFTMIFIILLFLILFKIDINNRLDRSILNENIRVNNMMDNITELSLFNVVENDEINTKKVANQFYFGIKFFLGEDYIDGVKVIILTKKDGFLFLERGKEDKKIYYSLRSETSHEDKVNELVEYTLKEYGINLLLPLNNGECDKNTITDDTLLSVYKKHDYFINNILCRTYAISASSIKRNLN